VVDEAEKAEQAEEAEEAEEAEVVAPFQEALQVYIVLND
jgi:hypothetical protein